ncbi:hypothetical protein [Herbaspirillum sp. SJZ099]|uniref:hypothetical protein n=1 Tax=Herbaspirillum sp. SJZ099 TaxID=2572916 RepID=UPI0011AAF31D|nr:hypothetical protein [Herbaspirillum sp. SJZ099]TWC67302.1 hypothetical protein FB597_104112 [Herbaspirillum sp. SJZ099]
MSTTVTITTTQTYVTDGPTGNPGNYRPSNGNSQEYCDIHLFSNSSQQQDSAFLDNLNIPDVLKNILRELMGQARANGNGSSGLPSESGAAKTINQFQKDNNIDLLSSKQVQQMAETGYFTDKDGNTKQVPPEVQLAAVKMMDNGGELFKKLESAHNGKHDGLLSQVDYSDALQDGSLSNVPGQGSGQYQPGLPMDFILQALMNGHVTKDQPDDYDAAKTINQFQKDNNIDLLSSEQMQQMAQTGYFTDKDGNTKQVPPEVQAAAQAFMDNGGELFKKLESALNGKHDGKLSQVDFTEAVKDGTIAEGYGNGNGYGNGQGNGYGNGSPFQFGQGNSFNFDPSQFGQGNNLPSDSSAVDTIQKYQKDNNIGLLSVEQMQQMAQTGYITDKDGNTKQVPPEVQAAAQAYMANGGELFKKIEAATDGKHDGQLGQGDPDEARKDGTLGTGNGNGYGNGQGNGYGNGQGNGYGFGNGNGQGNNLPTDSSAVNTIEQYQKDNKIDLLSSQQMLQMAQTGYFTDKDGNTKQVTPEVQAAAQAYMANDAELFKKIESAHTGKHDGQLSTTDAQDAVEDGTVSA